MLNPVFLPAKDTIAFQHLPLALTDERQTFEIPYTAELYGFRTNEDGMPELLYYVAEGKYSFPSELTRSIILQLLPIDQPSTLALTDDELLCIGYNERFILVQWAVPVDRKNDGECDD